MSDTSAAIVANTKFTADNIPRIADEICELIAVGYGLQQALDFKAEYPSARTFYEWLAKYEDVVHKYAHARERQQDYEADNIILIADTHPDHNKARLMIDARKWRASKLAPKKYGDKLDTTTTHNLGDGVSELFELISNKTRSL